MTGHFGKGVTGCFGTGGKSVTLLAKWSVTMYRNGRSRWAEIRITDGRGFKRIAKKLQKNWPSADSLPLASAQQILSRGLGYRDFHDLQQSVQKDAADAPLPSQAEVRDGICTSISAFCQSSKVIDIDESKLDRLVTLLPLQEFLVFKNLVRGQTSYPAPSKTLSPQMNANQKLSDAPIETTHIRQNVPLIQPISESGLKHIWEIVQRTGNLRDQCLFTLLLQGIRANELKVIKSRDISRDDDGALLRFTASKASCHATHVLLPRRTLDLIAKYINEAGLSEDD